MKNAFRLEPARITQMHDDRTSTWHDVPLEPQPAGFEGIVWAHHRANFDLWHEEDKARDPKAIDAEIAQVKHAIDTLNQRRNDLVEAMDSYLLTAFPEQNPQAPLNSETPGLMIDRLSILALKIYHTREEAHRFTATEKHRCRNAERLVLLEEQRNDLRGCLEGLVDDVFAAKRRFKLYRQMKMYNDPDLNPAVYGRGGS